MIAAALMLLAAAPAAERPILVTGHAWAPFISPMGEPFRARNAADDTLTRWFNQADTNRDGQITVDEMKSDAHRFFATLDTDSDGQIGPDELIHYEWELAPDIQVNSRLRRFPGEPAPITTTDSPDGEARSRRQTPQEALWPGGGLQGAARYGLLNLPEPVAAADADFDRAISRAEFEQAALGRFRLLDRDNRGSLTLAGLQATWTEVLTKLRKRKFRPEDSDSRIGATLPSDR